MVFSVNVGHAKHYTVLSVRRQERFQRVSYVSAVIMHQQRSGIMTTTHMKHGDGYANPVIKCSALQVILLTG